MLRKTSRSQVLERWFKIQDLALSDNAKVKAAHDALHLDLCENEKKCDNIQAVEGCYALVQLLKNCLDKATDERRVRAEVTNLYRFPELKTLSKMLCVIIDLTHEHDERQVGFSAIGGVEAVVKVMKSFPKCQTLQKYACIVLLDLALCRVGKKKVAEKVGIEVLIAAINNHLGHADRCERACSILMIVITDSNDNTELFIDLGGATAVVKVKNRWPENDKIQIQTRHLFKFIAAHFNRWAQTDEQASEIPVNSNN
jgi:hypothetical protein